MPRYYLNKGGTKVRFGSATGLSLGGGGGSAWLANLPGGATLIDQITFGTTTIFTDNTLHTTGENGLIQTRTPSWTQTSGANGYWEVYKAAGTGGAGSTDWGDFYCNIPSPPNNLYVAVDRLHGAPSGGYEWHTTSNKDIQIDTSGNGVLSQIFENGPRWQNFEILTSNYHPDNNLSNAAITSDVRTVYEYLFNYSDTSPRLRAYRDNVALCDFNPLTYFDSVNSTFGSMPTVPSFMEWYIHHFDGGGAYLRTRDSYIRYYRLALYRF